MNNGKKTALAFVLGILVGAGAAFAGMHFFAHYGFGHGREGWGNPRRLLKKFSRELHLTDEQKAGVEKVLQSKSAEIKDLRAKARPQFQAIMEAGQAEIRAQLKLDQQAKFDGLIREFEARRAKFEQKMQERK